MSTRWLIRQDTDHRSRHPHSPPRNSPTHQTRIFKSEKMGEMGRKGGGDGGKWEEWGGGDSGHSTRDVGCEGCSGMWLRKMGGKWDKIPTFHSSIFPIFPEVEDLPHSSLCKNHLSSPQPPTEKREFLPPIDTQHHGGWCGCLHVARTSHARALPSLSLVRSFAQFPSQGTGDVRAILCPRPVTSWPLGVSLPRGPCACVCRGWGCPLFGCRVAAGGCRIVCLFF